mgnify:CR=1 FL=1
MTKQEKEIQISIIKLLTSTNYNILAFALNGHIASVSQNLNIFLPFSDIQNCYNYLVFL